MLRFAPKETIDFIIRFTNACAEDYADSDLGEDEVEFIELNFGNNNIVKQCISPRLWLIYRGSHVNSSVLESIHMAFEKWLLEQARLLPGEVLEDTCVKILKESKSASITAVLTSVVLAYPDKVFNLACVLFKTKVLFSYDRHRFIQDSFIKLMQSPFGDRLHQDERVASYDESFRKQTLEGQALIYQFFKTDIVTDEEGQQRLDVLWNIWDDYYAALPRESEQTEDDKTWRLCLARMDRRGMTPTAKEHGDQVLLSFNPEIDANLEAFSNNTLQQNQEATKYSDLNVWGHSSWMGDGGLESYSRFTDHPSAVVNEIQNLIDDIEKGGRADWLFMDTSTIAYACSTLVRDYSKELSVDEHGYCKDVLINLAKAPFKEGYQPEFTSGIDAVIDVLPLLLGIDDADDSVIKTALLLGLFNTTNTSSNMSMRGHFVKAVRTRLWTLDPRSAQAIFTGYLLLFPFWELLHQSERDKAYATGTDRTDYQKISMMLLHDQDAIIKRIVTNDVDYSEVRDVGLYDTTALMVAFQLIPNQVSIDGHDGFLKESLPCIAKEFFTDQERRSFENGFFVAEKFANMLIELCPDDIGCYIEPFVAEFAASTNADHLLDQIIVAQDRTRRPDSFWAIWNCFYDKVVEFSNSGQYRRQSEAVVKTYLFANTRWNNSENGWHTFQERDKVFFEKVAKDIGGNPIVVYSLAKFLCGIGSSYAEFGAGWLSGIFTNYGNDLKDDLEPDTFFYLESFVRKLVLSSRQKIRSTRLLKQQILIILDFLIEKGSVAAYHTRDDIL